MIYFLWIKSPTRDRLLQSTLYGYIGDVLLISFLRQFSSSSFSHIMETLFSVLCGHTAPKDIVFLLIDLGPYSYVAHLGNHGGSSLWQSLRHFWPCYAKGEFVALLRHNISLCQTRFLAYRSLIKAIEEVLRNRWIREIKLSRCYLI